MSSEAVTAREQFDRQASNYNERWASWSDETLRRLLEWADPKPDWRVLDVATGTGFTALAFAPLVAEVVGADVSAGMLAEGAKRAAEQGIENVTWVEAAAETPPFPDESFDLVTCRIAPHHFVSIATFLAESRRVLKPGGILVIADTSVPDGQPEAAEWQNLVEKERDPSHVHNLTPSQWSLLCENAGLALTESEYRTGAITIPLSAWLDTAGAVGERAERVRQLFAEAPPAAVQEFRITTDEKGETTFSWARVMLRAVREA